MFNPPDLEERIVILMEEMGEAQQIIGKILRHGMYSGYVGPTNRELLEKEVGHVLHALDMLEAAQDISPVEVQQHKRERAENIKPYLHYQ
jgi:hypothetical protein